MQERRKKQQPQLLLCGRDELEVLGKYSQMGDAAARELTLRRSTHLCTMQIVVA